MVLPVVRWLFCVKLDSCWFCESFAVDADSACLLERRGQSTARCPGRLLCRHVRTWPSYMTRKATGDFPAPSVVRTYEGTCLLWWRRKLTYRTPVAIFIPAGVRTKPCRTLPRLVPKAESRERISSSGIQIYIIGCRI